MAESPLLEIRDLKKFFPVKGGFFKRVIGHVKAVNGVSFTIERSKTLGLVGESGCGKSTLGRAILRLQEPTSGEILFEGKSINQLEKVQMRHLRRDMQIIFQDPFASLNPRMTVMQIIKEPMDVHNILTPSERIDKVHELLQIVGLRQAVSHRYPHEFSGGQRQRVGIARALALNPKFIVADEPVSALDVSVQSQVLNLISELQERYGISFLFISHDLAVVQHISHDVGVMYLGSLVEKASALDLYSDPKHPYTRVLIQSVPVAEPRRKPARMLLQGDVPSPISLPKGCPFHPRCPEAKSICREKMPEQVNVGGNHGEHLVTCHLYSRS